MLSEVEDDEVEDKKWSEISKKGFAIKSSMSEIVPQWEGGEKTVGAKVFLTEGCKEAFVIKNEVESVGSFGET